MRPTAIVIVLLCVASASVGAADAPVSGDNPGFFSHVIRRIDARLSAASAARTPVLTPPKPIRVKWRARRISSVDLQAPLLDLAAADLDGDHKAELVALTTREVVVLKRERRRTVTVVTRVALTGSPAAMKPRLTVGTLSIGDTDGDGVAELYVRVSDFADGASYLWRDGKLESRAKVQGFPVCPGATVDLQPGRHVFLAKSLKWPAGFPTPKVAESLYGARCRTGMVNHQGRPMGALAVLDMKGHLAVHTWLACGADTPNCQPSAVSKRDVWYVGTAFAVADLDQDGRVEVVSAANRARGDSDRVSVYSGKGKRMRRVYRRAFSGGVVGVAAGDIDGDGDLDAVAAVRLLGSTRIDLWVLN